MAYIGIKSVLFKSKQHHLCFSSIAVLALVLALSETSQAQRRLDPALLEEYCKNFTHGDPELYQFYSPMYPREYPSNITCFRTITAEFGFFVRIDFRDVFRIEPPNNEGACEYDYLEVRDGDQGYAPLIGKYCGDKFPPIITSSGRSLWLRFSSDKTISYMGFKAVYTFIPNPLSNLPDIGKCTFETGGFQDFIGTSNITEDRLQHSLTYDTPIDCVWSIRADKGYKIYLQFPEYQLDHPNDCHINYIQVFDGKTDNENMLRNFCGSVADSVMSKTNLVYVRFYAEKSGLGSQFESIFTAMRALEGPNDQCDPDPKVEYDCDDATCIHPDLICNGIRNCRFGWDEESCVDPGATIALDFSSPHVILILILLIFILVGMGSGMIWNLIKTLREDKEEIAASRDFKSVAGTEAGAEDPELPTVVPPHPKMRAPTSSSYSHGEDANGGCYVPDGGFPFNSRF